MAAMPLIGTQTESIDRFIINSVAAGPSRPGRPVTEASRRVNDGPDYLVAFAITRSSPVGRLVAPLAPMTVRRRRTPMRMFLATSDWHVLHKVKCGVASCR